MSTITTSEIYTLRKQTGAGILDCKKALVEAEGNFEKAIEILRKKGQKIAAQRSDREANEGAVIAKSSKDNKKGIIIVLNSETDFVAKNDEFLSLANKIADIAVKEFPSNKEKLLKLKFDDKLTIEEKITELIGKIGEKIELSYYDKIESNYVCTYIHPGNRLATIVGFNKSGDNKIKDAAKQIAMQIAAMAPIAVDKENVPKEIIDKEIEIGKEQARAEGKPEHILEKIALGKLNKFFKENTLLNQDFVRDTKKTVRQYLKEIDKDLNVTEFKRIHLS